MKVNYVKTVGFRKFKNEFETELYNVTNITGKNRSGKSNVLYAIVNIMLGTNLSGDEKACLVNNKCDSSYGELHFTDNRGQKHILIRGKDKYNSNKNFISLDGKTVTQVELTSFYKDKKLFLSIINPMYFLTKKAAEQKEMVDKYLSDIRPKVIFDNLSTKQQNDLLKKYYKKDKKFEELTPKEQEDFINLNMFNICMDIAYSNLDKEEQAILEGIPSNMQLYITELNDNIKKANNTISVLDGKIEYAQSIADSELPERKKFEKDEELDLARQELAYLNTNQDIVNKEKQKQEVEKLEKEILSKETEYRQLQDTMKNGKKKYLEVKSSQSPICPTCNQNIESENKNIAITNMRNELMTLYDKSNVMETQIKDLKFNLSMERCKYHALEGNTTIEKTKRIATVTENIKQLEDEKAEIDKFNHEIETKENLIKNARADIQNFTKEKKTQTNCIDSLNKAKKVAQKLYISYIEEKMKLAKKYLKDVNLKFYSVLKTTGEIKEDFVITYKNKPLSDLSRSETIATSLEFANMFNQITTVNFPIFIDDYESCADYDFIKQYSKNSQVIVSKVEKGHPLKIADNNSDKCTIIKPVIAGYRTFNVNKNNVADIPKAA